MPIRVEAFYAPGCKKCVQARAALRGVAEAFGAAHVEWRDVDVLAETDRAVELGVMSPPAIAIDGELVFPAIPTAARFREELLRRLAHAGQRN